MKQTTHSYRDGKFIEGAPLEWIEGEGFDAFLERHEYMGPVDVVGHEDGQHFAFYSHKRAEHYLICLSTADAWRLVRADDFFDLALFIRDFAPAFAACAWDAERQDRHQHRS